MSNIPPKPRPLNKAGVYLSQATIQGNTVHTYTKQHHIQSYVHSMHNHTFKTFSPTYQTGVILSPTYQTMYIHTYTKQHHIQSYVHSMHNHTFKTFSPTYQTGVILSPTYQTMSCDKHTCTYTIIHSRHLDWSDPKPNISDNVM